MERDELNEIGTLLHIAETIVTNHPKYSAIARACGKRLDEINQECLEAEYAQAEEDKKAQADKSAAEYVPPTDGSEVQVEEPDEEPAAVERRV